MAKNEKPKDPTSPISAGGGREQPDKGGQRPGQGNPGQQNPGQNPGQGGQRPDQDKPGQGGQR
ncbi:MAG TPA: hypothetical protein VIG52_09265 [Methyloceanibacter sp.]|jgi:hypothetical protein